MTPSKRNFSSRVRLFTESVIREMTRLSNLHNCINLAQGFPDFPAPAELKEAAVNAIRNDYNQYAITWGSKPLREAIARKMAEYNRLEADPEVNIVVTCGSTEAMMATMLAIVNPGDEVVIFEPFYENYGPDAAVSGAKPRFVPLEEPNFIFDEEALKAAFSHRTKAIIVNTPHNPTGKVFGEDELKTIADLCVDYDVFAVTDEVYEYILYDGHRHISLATLDGMQERTITISGLSKTYSVTGWRLGYAVADKPIMDHIKKVHDFLTVGAPAPLQEAAVEAFRLASTYYQELRKIYDENRQLLLSALSQVGLKCFRPQGAYYIMADFSPLGFKSDYAFIEFLIKHVGVAAVPGSSFYHHPRLGTRKVRFTFSKGRNTVAEAVRRILKIPELTR